MATGPEARFTNVILLTIQMWWEFQHAVVSRIFHYYPPIIAQVSTAVLLRHVQNLVEIELLAMKLEHVEILIIFELWVKPR